MNNKLIIGSLVLLFSTVFTTPQAIAQTGSSADGLGEPTDNTRAEETIEAVNSGNSDVNYDVRRTEAFNLVSSAYRGDFEEQGINSYAVLETDYESGELTAEDLINAAIETGELSPKAIEDESYIEAVDNQLNALTY
ncbi:MAG: hypothetical protein AAF383_11825 [Cyanobacteria bacterium P01_A01_bin.83]